MIRHLVLTSSSSRSFVSRLGSTIPLSIRFASTFTHSSSSQSSSSSSSYNRSRTPLLPPVSPLSPRIKPSSSAYYTARQTYIDTLLDLEKLTRQTKRLLEQSHIISSNLSPPSSPSTLSGRRNLWKTKLDLQSTLETNLKTSQYRQIIQRLTILSKYRHILHDHIDQNQQLKNHSVLYVNALSKFMNNQAKQTELSINQKDRTKAIQLRGKIDELGRGYSRGRRKEASAQVWIIPTKSDSSSSSSSSSTTTTTGDVTKTTTTPCEILINNQPIQQFFTRTCHREQVVWPFKLTGSLGGYNVFALVRGGGLSGQAGAIAHGIANALLAIVGQNHVSDPEKQEQIRQQVKEILAKDGILKRDPRMVERKKTGLAKARKAYTWVKR